MTRLPAKHYENCTDSELALLVKDSDETAFEYMTARYMKLISTVASRYRFGADGYDINDFVQEGLLGLLSACKTYNDSSGNTFKNYAMLCIENRFRSIIRHHNKKSSVPKSSIVPIDDETVDFEDINSMDIQESLESKDYISSVYKKIRQTLSELEQRVLSMYLLGYTYCQISTALEISEKAVDNALYRIRKKLNR